MNKRIFKAVPSYNKKNKYIFHLLINILKIKVVKKYTTFIFNILQHSNVYIFEDNIKNIPKMFFYDCVFLEEVIIPESVLVLENFCFSFCTSLKNIIIPNSVIHISNSAFTFCVSLEKIIISSSIKMIGFHAFSGCKNLKPFNIPNPITVDMNVFPNHLKELIDEGKYLQKKIYY